MSERERPMSTADLASAGQSATGDPAPQGAGATGQSPTGADGPATALLPAAEVSDLQVKWNNIQAGFVDEPRRAVENADALVAGAMKRLAEVFATERSQLEAQWDRGDNVSTEDLRLALQRYRAFFGRLLAV